MIELLNILNRTGDGFCRFALVMLVQSGILIALLYLIDLLVRKHVRAVFRYCIWMLVFVKLILPPTLCLPTGIGYWCGLDLPSITNQAQNQPATELAAIDSSQSLQPPVALGISDKITVTSPDTAHTPPLATVTVIKAEDESSLLAPAAEIAPITWQAVVFLIWFVGVLVLSALLFQRFLFVKGLLAQSDTATGRLRATFEQCCQQVGINRNIKLRL